jgi:ferredoxin-NADP reductase
MTEGTSEILSIEVVAKDVKKIIFSRPENFNFQAGQFLLIKYSPKLMRAYSIASEPGKKNIELIIRIIPGGQGSTIIDAAKVGDKFTIAGGMGHLLLSEKDNAELFFCVTGTGIAPIKSMINNEAKKKNPRKMTLFYGGRNREDLAYLEELNTWATNLDVKLGLSGQENAKTLTIPNLKAEIDHCRITKFLEEGTFSDLAEFYICGNKGMVEGTNQLLLEKGIKKENIYFERFT